MITNLDDPPNEQFSMPSDEIPHNLTIEPSHDQGEIGAEHEKHAMT